MRGKNIIWMTLILALGIALLGPVKAPVTNTKISVSPTLINGLPGDSFIVFVNVENVNNLYAFGFTLNFAPFSKVVAVVNVMDGGFLMGPGGEPAFISSRRDSFHGLVQVGGTLLGALPGASGSGTLAMVEFVVLEAGESKLDLSDTVLLDTNLMGMPHNTFNGFYQGPTANLVRKELTAHSMWTGMRQTFTSSAKNLGTVPLYVRTRWTMTNELGTTYTHYGGERTYSLLARPTEYLYVDGYQTYLGDWTTVGTSPWLSAPEDGNYIEDTINGHNIGKFTFQDLTLGPTDIVKSVSLEFYTFGPYDEGNDFDVIAREPIGEVAPSMWMGSAYSSGSPGWTGLRWVDTQDLTTYFASLKTEAGINAFKIRYISFYTSDGAPRPVAGIDAARLKVEFAGGLVTVQEGPANQVIQPNEVLEISPYIWDIGEGLTGRYYCTATLEYKYYPDLPGQPRYWADGTKVSSFSWIIRP